MTRWQGGLYQPLNGFMRRPGFALLTLLLTAAVTASVAAAPNNGAEKKGAGADDGPPEPMVVPLQTKDGVALKATYYPGTKGKKTVPIVILHEWKGNRAAYKDLALYLQSKGHAVMVPDLRGHGESTVQLQGNRPPLKLSALRTSKKDVQLMVSEDMEAVKRYLRDRNNDEELNIEKLCVIGVEMGGVVAANWAKDDWFNWPVLPSYKQGQDVKALVLISPEWAFKGMSMQSGIDNEKLQSNPDFSMLVMVGSQDKHAFDVADKTNKILSKFHAEPPKDAPQKKTLFYVKVDTLLQGSKLINQPELLANRYISGFIDARLVEQSFPWSKRERP